MCGLAYFPVIGAIIGSFVCVWFDMVRGLQMLGLPGSIAGLIFTGDHGAVAAIEDGGESCYLYPQAVTRCILRRLECGVARACVLARNANLLQLRVVDMGSVRGEAFHDGKVVILPDKEISNLIPS